MKSKINWETYIDDLPSHLRHTSIISTANKKDFNGILNDAADEIVGTETRAKIKSLMG